MACDMMPAPPPGPLAPIRTRTGSVVPFPTHRLRQRDPLRDDEPRGKILLFLGVRYERMPEAVEPAPRRRRRS